jgi:hypothetical protein
MPAVTAMKVIEALRAVSGSVTISEGKYMHFPDGTLIGLHEVVDKLPETPQDGEINGKYRAAAKQRQQDGELEVDENAAVSIGNDDGAYVQCWIWIRDPEAGIEGDGGDGGEDSEDQD